MTDGTPIVEGETAKLLPSSTPWPGVKEGNSSTLPTAFKVETAYDNADFDKTINGIRSNPIVQLCTRLAVCRMNRDQTVYDPKVYGIKGRQRLFLMIGRRLGVSAFRRMSILSTRQWKMIEESWTALMHSVLLHSEYNPLLRDRELRLAISKFKIWFLRFSLKGHIRVSQKTGKKYVVLTRWDQMISGLKAISGWFQYYALDDKKLNVSPPQLPWMKGWSKDHPTFPWFAGHLKHFRNLHYRKMSDLDIRTLCQIRTFGRALPPPSKSACVKDLIAQVKVLTEPKIIPELALTRVSEVSALLADRLKIGELPMFSHISVSTSGCFEVPQKDGGMAAYVRGWVKELDVPTRSVRIIHDDVVYGFIDHRLINNSSNYRDCYGNRMFPIPWAGDDPLAAELLQLPERRKKAVSMAYLGEGRKSFLDKFYRQPGFFRKSKATLELLSRNIYPKEICPAILAVASSEAILQGRFLDLDGIERPPDMWLLLPSGRKIPIWNSSFPLRYESVDFPLTQMQCLAEPGAKTRSLGKNQAWFTIVTKIMRFMIEPILARDGRARIGLLSTNKMWSFLKYIQRTKSVGQWQQSTDYRASTDHIGLNMIKAMWKPWFSKVRKGHPFLVYEDLVFCPRRLRFSGMFTIADNGKPHACGSFMGEPMSFMTLTLINLIFEELTAFYDGKSLFATPVTQLVSYEPVAICGDDVAALRRKLTTIMLFKRIVDVLGMVLSWKDGISRRLLIFCEEHILVQDQKFVYIDVVKSRLLTTMARQHSDNRSAILGKGRMLGTQLNYFDNKVLKIFIMNIFDQIFDRSHKYEMRQLTMPYFLPPSCGGLGYPVPTEMIPEWGFTHIGYIFKLLEDPSILSRYVALYELSRLNKRNKHGIDNSANAIKVFKRISYTDDIVYDDSRIEWFKTRTVYPDFRIREVLTDAGISIPDDPYTGGPDRDHLRNEAQRFGIIRLDDLFEQIERTLNFDVFFREEVVREQRTFEQWIRRSGKYWKKALYGLKRSEQIELADYGRSKFKDLADLDNKVLRSFSGYVCPLNWGTLDSAGPSLRIDFRHYRAQNGRYPFADRKPISTDELIRLMPIQA